MFDIKEEIMFTNRKPTTTLLLAVLLLVVITVNACMPVKPTRTAPDTGALYTQAVQTVSAQLTQAAGATAVAQLTQMAQSSPTLLPPTQTNPATATATSPADTPVPVKETTATRPAPTPTRQRPTSVPLPCDAAAFVADVSAPDGTKLQPGTHFTKTWRLQNVGACTWNADYDLIYADGDRLSGAKTVSLNVRVKPGQTVDVSVDLVAPSEPGEYKGWWQLRNADGERFGIGAKQDKSFWVKIEVVRPLKIAWDLAKDACLAGWSSAAASSLACPDSTENTQTGFINLHDRPRLETGRIDDETALVTYPNAEKGGYIQGLFPAYKVKNGDHFRAVIGCLDDSKGCKVTFQLSYRAANGRIKSLGAWREKFDGKIQNLDVDLSKLAGKEVELILSIYSIDGSTNNYAFWLRPSIWR
jgi:hypothetical protein